MLIRIILVIVSAGCFIFVAYVTWTDTIPGERYGDLLFILPTLTLLFLNFFYVLTMPTNHSIGNFFRRFITAWKSASKDE